METMSKGKRMTAQVTKKLCVACGCCAKACPVSAVNIYKGMYAIVDASRCVGCGRCRRECPASIIEMMEVAS
ncbi:MAG TPA: 4Fe-4S binding protein [Candidatus Copromorpha excrementipullorum]|uniref:4Fe-4S binding protein n=2 Tax=Eubacteriaceae TaxID=186806 RepID=A0A9D1N5T2_9FIRM|nr:4Fe-4S binding protein [Candidatus Copromorpha excrementipullorum]